MTVNTAREAAESAAWSPAARAERSRARIIQASIDLIVEDGPKSLTVDAISERSGVAKSTLYRHWPSVEALIVDVFRAAVPDTFVPEPTASFEDALRRQVAAMAETLADSRWIKLLPTLLSLRDQYPEIGELADQDRAQKQAALAAILTKGASQGLVPTTLDVTTVVATLVGPMVLCALFHEPQRIQEVGAFAVDRFLDSYRADAHAG